MGWDHDESAQTRAYDREPDHTPTCVHCEGDLDTENRDDADEEARGLSLCWDCWMRDVDYDRLRHWAWQHDPSRCGEEDCLNPGTEPWADRHYGPYALCRTHYAERASQEAGL